MFRYQYVYRTRITGRGKQKFLKSLITDIVEMRDDIQIIEYDKKKKSSSHNLYVGNIEKADKIICTYYDTPPNHTGDYLLFNTKDQQKKTTKFIMISSLMLMLIGLITTTLLFKSTTIFKDIFSPQTILLVIVYGIYFFIFGKVTKGHFYQKTLIRNTSSVLTLLKMIEMNKSNKKIAFAFVDDGCYGERGLEAMMNSAKKSSKIYYLDSIGANESLKIMGKDFNSSIVEKYHLNPLSSHNKVNYLFSANKVEKDGESIFLLSKNNLKQKKINMANINMALELLN